ncbi:hypothetical protein BY996DRAFT_4589772, partial [Phakopsora pachyrhizi]
YVLQTHKTINIKVDMNAPIIIIPQDVTRFVCQHIMIDAGHISISSNLATMESYEAIKAKQNSNNTDEDHAQIESMMYDCFNIELKDTQLILGNTFEQCTSALKAYQGNEDAHFLE